MSYVDALFDRDKDRIHVVERVDGRREYREYPANYVFYYDDPRGKFQSIYGTPDFWLWIYLVFAVSNAMLPSAADWHAWGTALIFLGILVAFVYLTGLVQLLTAGPIAVTLSSWVRNAVDQLTWAFGITVAVDLVIALILFATEQTLGLLGLGRLQYR